MNMSSPLSFTAAARTFAVVGAAFLAFGCTTVAGEAGSSATIASMPAAEKAKFEQDRKAILAMAGDYYVTFDFRETVSLTPGYELKKPKVSGADEIVRLVEDRGDFISLQHILVMKMGGEPIVTKHWRQDLQLAQPAEPYAQASVVCSEPRLSW